MRSGFIRHYIVKQERSSNNGQSRKGWLTN
jgi:hypothetical protein